MKLRALSRVLIVLVMGGMAAGCGLLDMGTIGTTAVGPAVALPPAGRAAFYVRVERGQSLDQLAKLYRVPKQRIVVVNNLAPPYRVAPGSHLEIPLDGLKRFAKLGAPRSAKAKTKTMLAGKTPKKAGPSAQARVKRRTPETATPGPA